jgi:hypothetical protein
MAIDPLLLARARQLLNRARVMSEAPAAKPDDVGHGHPTGRPPSGVRLHARVATMRPQLGLSTVDVLERRFIAALKSGRDETMREATDWAAAELRLLTHGPDRSAETPQQRRHRILTDYEGRHYADVADRERIHKTYVWKIRIAAGKDGVWGREKSQG